MAELTVKGFASKDVICDLVQYSCVVKNQKWSRVINSKRSTWRDVDLLQTKHIFYDT